MATKVVEETNTKKENPILKKRTLPDTTVKQDETSEKKSPLKKRTTPLDEPNAEKSVASLLKKRELPTDSKESAAPLKKKVNPLDIQKEEPKEKSSLDKMRERIAAQKKLEQDMMTQQSLRNQEKVSMRNKLSALTKDLNEEAEELDDEEIVVPTPKAKPAINFDLKSEALETQNKKLKADLEKSKQQLQALLALEYQNMKVLDSSSLSLSNEFLENLNSLKEQFEAQKNLEEQSLKEELNSLQKELVDLKNKNAAAKKASDEARKAAAQAEKAIEETKRVIEEQENDQIRNFKEEIKELEKQIKDKEKQIAQSTKEKEAIIKEYNEKFELLKQQSDNQVKQLTEENEQIKANEQSLNNQISSLKEDILNKDNLILEGQKVINENIELKAKIEQQEKDYQDKLQIELNKAFEETTTLNKQIKDLEQLNNANKEIGEENKLLKDDIKQKDNKINELLKLENEFNESQQQLSNKQKEVERLTSEINSLPTKAEVSEMQTKINSLEANVKANANLQSKLDQLLIEKTNLENTSKQLQEENAQLKQKLDEYIKLQEQQIEAERQAKIDLQVNEIQVKIDENIKVASELKEQYDRFISAKQKYISSYAVIRKYNTMVPELNALRAAAKKVSDEVSALNPKTDKKAYRAKVAEAKSMNSKVLYLEKQMKKLYRNKNVSEYAKLLEKITEFDSQFESINNRNLELQSSIDEIKNK